MPNTEALDILSVYLTNARGGNCGTGAGGFKKGNTCAVGSGTSLPTASKAPEVGDVVKITGGEHKGSTGSVVVSNLPLGGALVKIKGRGNRGVLHEHLKSTGKVDKGLLDEMLEDARDSVGSRKEPKTGDSSGGVKTFSGKTQYTKGQLYDASLRAGKGLFKGQLEYTKPTGVEHVKLSDLQRQKIGEGDEAVDDWEYVFKPSTGKGMDVSGKSWKNATKGWADKDGNIYTYYEGTVRVVHPDAPLKEARRGEGKRQF
jgi:hypothetical protein